MAFLGDKSVGDVVKIKENGTAVNYLIVHKGKPSDMYDDSCDGVWLLREEIHRNKGWDGTSKSYDNDYENSDINAWLNSDFLNTIDEKIRAEIKTVKIPFKKGVGNAETGVYSGANGLSCKVFLLSGYELGWTTSSTLYIQIDGSRLSYFEDGTTTSANNKRKANFNGKSALWWTRSSVTNNENKAKTVGTEGDSFSFDTYYTFGARPAFVLSPYLLVDDDGNVSTSAVITASPVSSDNKITVCSLKVEGSIPEDANVTYEVTNNANDASPVWENCTEKVKAGFAYIFANKTAENGFAFNFRVTISRGASGSGGYITSISGGFE